MVTLCPIAIVASCKQCPLFSICPGKTLIGDYRPNMQQGTQEGQSESEGSDAAP